MAHKPSPRALTEFFAKNTGIARIGTYEQLHEKLRRANIGIDFTPAYAMNLIIDEDIKMYAYAYVDVLPPKGQSGVFYVLPSGGLYIYQDGKYFPVGGAVEISKQDKNALSLETDGLFASTDGGEI